MRQTAVEWLEVQLDIRNKSDGMIWHFQKAKEMEKEQKNNMPIHIHEGISNFWVYIEDGVVHVKPNDKTYGGKK